MIEKLPKWVWLGAAILALSAGMVNVIAILGFVHKGITHVTGNCSVLSIAMLEGDWKSIVQAFFIVASFFFGSVLAGVIIGNGHLKMGRRYGFALAVESALLLVSTYGFVRGLIYGEYFASMAAGLQNAMASTYSGTIVRTTHLTGTLTDLGAIMGNRLRGIKADRKRVNLLAVIFFSFLSGGLLGAFYYRLLGALAMLVPAAVIGVSSLGYEFFRLKMVQKNPESVIRLAQPVLVESATETANTR